MRGRLGKPLCHARPVGQPDRLAGAGGDGAGERGGQPHHREPASALGRIAAHVQHVQQVVGTEREDRDHRCAQRLVQPGSERRRGPGRGAGRRKRHGELVQVPLPLGQPLGGDRGRDPLAEVIGEGQIGVVIAAARVGAGAGQEPDQLAVGDQRGEQPAAGAEAGHRGVLVGRRHR